MRARGLAVVLVGAVVAGCSGSDPTADVVVEPNEATPVTEAPNDDGGDNGAAPAERYDGGLVAEAGHDAAVDSLLGLLPPDARGVVAVDVAALAAIGSSEGDAFLAGDGPDPAWNEVFATIGRLAAPLDVAGSIATALVVQTTDATDGQFLLAALPSAEVDVPADDDRFGVLPGGVLVAGSPDAVESVIAAADEPADTAIDAFLAALDPGAHLTFVHGMPALFSDVPTDRTLRGAAAVSGAITVVDGEITGTMAFHTENAGDFVEAYNTLDRHATQGEAPSAEPLTLAEPIVDGFGQVVVPLPAVALDATFDEVRASRNVAKKLFVGMEAYDYAEDVFNPGNDAWFDFLVKSELDDTPPSPGSIYIRWEFRDQAAVEAFEANELPAGFRIAPTRFLESDPPEGGYFLALNLYNGGGGMIVGGARAEWDVFVHGPDGADPNAGVRPRFMVVDVAAEEVSANSGDLLTPAEPVSHELVDGIVTSSVRRLGEDVPVFQATFPVPDPATDEVARFTREMAIGNDYIYWAHGVSDRVLYNATTFNHDAYFIDPADITVVDTTRWREYLQPEVSDAVYYVNTLEYVASPMANLVDSEHLDITPEWREELLGFVNNGHQVGLMRKAVELLFRGQADALVEFEVPNENPSTYYHFEITDPAGLEAALELPPGHRLAPTTLFEGGEPGLYLTLAVTEAADAMEGTRAEWIVYTDDGDGRPPAMMVVDLLTEEVAFDPVSIVNLPSDVRHELDAGTVSTRLSSGTVAFEASFDTGATTEEELSLDWIEAGDTVCHLNDVCDRLYYDAETLDVPVRLPAEVVVDTFDTPWNDFVAAEPSVVFFRDNAQLYVTKRWENLAVPVDELPFTGLADPTHTISGTGSLVGRTGDIADSEYTYRGDVVLTDDRITFALDQQVVNALGEGHIYTTGTFDLATGTGTQTVVDCQGPALLCSGIENGSTEFYTAQDLDASDPDAITWNVDVAVDLGGTFGIADSSSTFLATRTG